MKKEERDFYRAKLLGIMTQHIGREKTIGMGELFNLVFERPWFNRINDTRNLRTIVTDLRRQGVAICSTADTEGGGYYLASAGSELEDYLRRLRLRALRALAIEAEIRKVSLPELLGQMQLNLER